MMHRVRPGTSRARHGALVVSGLVVSAALLGAQPPTGLTLPTVERLGTEHGLSHNSVYAVLEDRQGFLWFGTQSGLNRFDGRDFVVFGHDPNDPRSLGSSWIHALLEDRGGHLLVGTRAGLYRRADDGAGFERMSLVPNGAPDPAVTALAEAPDGVLWVGAGNGLFRITPDRRAVTAIDPVSARTAVGGWGRVRHLRLLPDGAVWALEENDVGQVSLIRATPPTARYDLPYAWAFVMNDAGEVWLDPRRRIPTSALGTRPVPALDGIFTTAFADTHQRLWIGTLAGLLVRTSTEAALARVPLDGLGLGALTHEITAIVEDRVGTIWLGTFGGVLRFDPHRKAFAHLVHREGDPATLASNAVSSVQLDQAGTLWVGTYGAGLDAIDRATGRIVHHRQRPHEPASLCNDYVWDLAPSRHVTVWIGLPGMFCSYADGRFRRHALPDAASNALTIRETADGSVWLGTTGGLYRYDGVSDGVELMGNADSGLMQPIDAMREDGGGRLWLGSVTTGDLAWFDPVSRGFQVFRGVGREGVWDFTWDLKGAMWLATGVGLASFDTTSGLPTYATLPPGTAPAIYYSILPDDAGRLWLGTSRGLVRYDPASREFRTYPGGNGPGHVEFNRHAAHRANSGELFFGGMNGLTSFVPDRIADNPYRPPVVLTGVRAFGGDGERRLRPAADGLTLTAGDRTVWFDFAALNFTEGARNRYAYRLEGFDADWIDAGVERTARYTSLPVGEYLLRVRGSNNDGLWSDREVAVAVTVLPPFWQTWWFRAAALMAVAGLLIAAHRLRTAHLLGLERLRLRIASDLHDELGSELSGIALASGLVARQPELSDRDRSRLTAVSASAHKVMDGLRDIIWCISPDHDTLESMEQRMRSVARTLLADIPHEFQVTGPRVADLDMAPRRHLFLIYKELLHNIVRHARATSVRIALEATADALRLQVTDNGQGLTTGSADGSGLRNIRRRAQEMGAELAFETPPDGGTAASVVVRLTRTRRSAARRTKVL